MAVLPWLVVCCGPSVVDRETTGIASITLTENGLRELSSQNLSVLEKIARYPAADSLGLLDERFLWMERIELVAGLHFLQDKVQDSPIIAVLDSGVDYLHPALKRNMYQKPGNIASHCDDDTYGCDTSNYLLGAHTLGNGNIFPAGTQGPDQYCLSRKQGVHAMECSHGTHVAGVIAGFSEDQSIFGICPQCRILAIKVVGREGTIADQSIIGALQYIDELKRQGVPIRVVNSSFGKFLSSERVAAALESLPRFKDDILVVAAAGNENTWLHTYPASFAHVIAVANVNSSNLKKDAKSNFGRWVDISAPVGNCNPDFVTNSGFGIVSAIPGNGSRCANGTSVAAPQVAAVAGLILSMEPTISIAELRERILRGADGAALYDANPDYLQTIEGNQRVLLGSGVLNVNHALRGEQSGLRLDNKNQGRVKGPHCGTIALEGSDAGSCGLMILWLAPLSLFLLGFLDNRGKLRSK